MNTMAAGGSGRRDVGWLITVVAVTVVIVVVVIMSRSPQVDTKARHIVVISLDTARRDHFGCYGNPWMKTPNVDRLARESILFTDYMTVVTTTLASHTSLFTGKYPHSHGVPRNGFMVSRENMMLPEILRDAGFTTIGAIGSFVLSDRFDFAQGFDFYNEDLRDTSGAIASRDERPAEEVTDAVIAYLERNPIPERLFLFVHYFDPHKPYSPSPPYDKMYGFGPDPERITIENHPTLMTGEHDAGTKWNLRKYAGEISYMDYHIGRLIAYLEEKDILDRALLVLTSDHGENLGDSPGEVFDHGWTVSTRTRQLLSASSGCRRRPGEVGVTQGSWPV